MKDVWHTSMILKFKSSLLHHNYQVIRPYLKSQYFFAKINVVQTYLLSIEGSVYEISVLVSLFYILFTADLSITNRTKVATFADDAAILATHNQKLHHQLPQ